MAEMVVQPLAFFIIPDESARCGKRIEVSYVEVRDQSDDVYMNKTIGISGDKVERLLGALEAGLVELIDEILDIRNDPPDTIERGE